MTSSTLSAIQAAASPNARRVQTNVSHSVAAANSTLIAPADLNDSGIAELAGDDSERQQNQVEDEVTVRAERQREGVVRGRAAQQVQLHRFVGGKRFDEARVRRADADERHEARRPQGHEQTGEETT